MFVVKNSKLFLILGLIIFITADVVAMRPLGSQKGVSIDRQKAMIEALKGAGIDPLTGKPRSVPLKAEVSPLSGDRFGSPALKPGSFPTRQGIDARKVMLQGLREKRIDPLTACKQNDLFIQEQGSSREICVSSDIIGLSTTLSNALEYVQKDSKEIKVVFGFPIDVMKDTFDILKIYNLKIYNKGGISIKEKIKGYSLNHLIGIANFIDFLDCPEKISHDIVDAILKYIKDGNFKEVLDLQIDLNPQLVTSEFVDPSIKFLKDRANSREIYLQPTGKISSVAFSPDSKRIVASINYEGKGSFIIWDISNIHKITQYESVQSSVKFGQAVFSPDGKKIISVSLGDLVNPDAKNILSIWDTSDESNITKIPLGVDPSFSIIALSSDGKRIVSNKGNEVVVSDITDLNNITHQKFTKFDRGWIQKAVLSSDGKKIVFVSYNIGGDSKSVSVYDISNMNEIKYGKLIENDPDRIFTVALSPDGKRIVIGSTSISDVQHNLTVWDISDMDHITDQALEKNTIVGFFALAFSPDGKRIVSNHPTLMNNLIVWNVSDMSNVTRQTFLFLLEKNVKSVAFSPDGKSIQQATPDGISVLMPLTGEEEAVLNQLEKCNFTQISLISRLCLQSRVSFIEALQPNSPEDTVFKTLPTDVQQLLSDLFWLNWPIFVSPKEEQQILRKKEQQATGWFSDFWNLFK